MFANEEHAIDLCKSCFQQNTQQIPEGKVVNGYYCCWEGDTVSRISRQVNVNVSKIVSMNDHIPDLNGRTVLKAGTILKVADGKLKIGTFKEDHEVEENSLAADKENNCYRNAQMSESEKNIRRARLKDVLNDLCSEKYHPLEKINAYYNELNYCCKDNDRAVKIWVLRAKIREELGDVTSYLKSFLGGNKYNVYWDAAEKGASLRFSPATPVSSSPLQKPSLDSRKSLRANTITSLKLLSTWLATLTKSSLRPNVWQLNVENKQAFSFGQTIA